MIDWHRLFGLALMDFFAGTPYAVELEKDLSLKQQLLDVVILRRGQGVLSERPPDGLDDLAEHNLLTYKSLHEPLDDWALKDLTGHYVNYRKTATPDAWQPGARAIPSPPATAQVAAARTDPVYECADRPLRRLRSRWGRPGPGKAQGTRSDRRCVGSAWDLSSSLALGLPSTVVLGVLAQQLGTAARAALFLAGDTRTVGDRGFAFGADAAAACPHIVSALYHDAAAS